jgi:hypothetical protein
MPLVAMRILEKSPAASLRVLLAGAMLSISPVAALAATTNFHPGFAGIYVTHQIKVTFDASEGEPVPAPMVFEPVHGKLQAISWDHQAWGTAQPPAMIKGYKVKYLFWSTTMR